MLIYPYVDTINYVVSRCAHCKNQSNGRCVDTSAIANPNKCCLSIVFVLYCKKITMKSPLTNYHIILIWECHLCWCYNYLYMLSIFIYISMNTSTKHAFRINSPRRWFIFFFVIFYLHFWFITIFILICVCNLLRAAIYFMVMATGSHNNVHTSAAVHDGGAWMLIDNVLCARRTARTNIDDDQNM